MFYHYGTPSWSNLAITIRNCRDTRHPGIAAYVSDTVLRPTRLIIHRSVCSSLRSEVSVKLCSACYWQQTAALRHWRRSSKVVGGAKPWNVGNSCKCHIISFSLLVVFVHEYRLSVNQIWTWHLANVLVLSCTYVFTVFVTFIYYTFLLDIRCFTV